MIPVLCSRPEVLMRRGQNWLAGRGYFSGLPGTHSKSMPSLQIYSVTLALATLVLWPRIQ